MSQASNQKRLFLGCFVALVATAFGFAVRGAVLTDWAQQFNLSEEQKGIINGVGVAPFAISIILFSFFIDRIGYGTAMTLAFVGHVTSTLLTIFAPSYGVLYAGTFLFALSNGMVEAVINPVVATVYRDNKTHWLNVLHAGWPGGLVLGGLLAIVVSIAGKSLGASLPGHLWQWQMAVLMLPIVVYGFLLAGQSFPTQERVEAGVSFREMLEEFGWGSAYIVSFLIIMSVSQVLSVLEMKPIEPKMAALFAIVPAVIYAYAVRTFGRPIFVFLLLVMFLLSTTELGTDGWIQDIMGSVLQDPTKGTLFIVYTAVIMFVLRFFAGPIVHRISPLGLLACSAALATIGLICLGNAGPNLWMLLVAATIYGVAKTFFWPTTLGVVSEQYPRGGALLLNAMGGVGMIAVGTIGGPAIGTLQDRDFNVAVQEQAADVHDQIAATKQGLFNEYQYVDHTKFEALSADEVEKLAAIERETKQQALAKIAVLPAIMCVCYLALIVYFKSQGGYKAEVLTGHAANDEKFTGGTVGPGEG